jgi:plasmid maintenance system antidote protein VapI
MDDTAAMAELRKRLTGKTQKELAAAFDITPQYLSDILSGKRAISPKLANKLGFEPRLVKSR